MEKKEKKTPQQMLDATKRTQYVDKDAVETMPQDESEEKLEFFTLGKYISDDELEKEYASRGLIPAFPYDLLKADQDILDEKKYAATHWKDANGKWCYLACYRWRGGERNVSVDRREYDWYDDWWFAGVRKIELSSSSAQDSQALSPLPEILTIDGFIYKRQ